MGGLPTCAALQKSERKMKQNWKAAHEMFSSKTKYNGMLEHARTGVPQTSLTPFHHLLEGRVCCQTHVPQARLSLLLSDSTSLTLSLLHCYTLSCVRHEATVNITISKPNIIPCVVKHNKSNLKQVPDCLPLTFTQHLKNQLARTGSLSPGQCECPTTLTQGILHSTGLWIETLMGSFQKLRGLWSRAFSVIYNVFVVE